MDTQGVGIKCVCLCLSNTHTHTCPRPLSITSSPASQGPGVVSVSLETECTGYHYTLLLTDCVRSCHEFKAPTQSPGYVHLTGRIKQWACPRTAREAVEVTVYESLYFYNGVRVVVGVGPSNRGHRGKHIGQTKLAFYRGENRVSEKLGNLLKSHSE